VLFCFSLTLSAFGLVACNQGNGGGESGQTEFQKVYSQYVINAQAAGETPLSYEEWLNTIKGEKGDPGENGVGIEKVELNADGNLVITFTDGSTQTVDMPVSGTQTPPLEEHDFGAWALYDFENFTCENGLFYRTCSDCNAVEWKKGTENDHDWADSYSSNNTYHWIACKNCGKRLNEEEHSFLNASCQACGKIRVSSSSSSKSSSSVVLYGVSLDKTEATLEVGQTLTLVATTNPANYNGTATWSSTNRDVAVVEDGVVTAIAEGTTTIKVKYGTGSSAKSATCLITVEKVAPCTSVSLNKSSVSLGVGGTETLVATTNPTDTTDTISWFTDDASVATVANGIVTAVDVGSTTITVQCGDQMATCLITVGPTDGVLYEVVGDIARVVGYEGTATRVRLAETYENAPVTEIYANAFKGKLIASVIIPDSVTSIGEDAFRSCDNLTSVVIGDSVDSIGDSAFSWCSNLTSIEIPDSVTSISNYAFRSCYNLTSVVIGGGVETIYSYAFSDCTNLTDVYYQGTADDWARIWFFDNYSNPLYHAENFYINNELVTEINLTTVTNVFDCEFSGCDSLTSVVLGDGVTSIGYSAFYNCSKLT
ncbi:MAG: leucine-rich repeat protein, partial [Clostridia bacterium]|nr:leucine-rich repeat protein [Clostridia bacterium]